MVKNSRFRHSACQFVSVNNHMEVTDMTRIGKWGHSGAIRINANVLECAQLGIGDEVLVRNLNDGSLLIIPAKKRNGVSISAGGKSGSALAKEPGDKW